VDDNEERRDVVELRRWLGCERMELQIKGVTFKLPCYLLGSQRSIIVVDPVVLRILKLFWSYVRVLKTCCGRGCSLQGNWDDG